MTDDREQFVSHARAQAAAMGRDENLQRQSIDMMLAADNYDYSYQWFWMGVPIIQLPADIMATQEIIWETRPTIIIETGVARGGSILMMASLLKLIGGGKVIGVDIDIRAHNRNSIETHLLYDADSIVLIEGSSIADDVLAQVKTHIKPNDRVMVVLDSDHSRTHVLAECHAYGPLVTQDCYLVVADTASGMLSEDQAPKRRSKIWFEGNEPLSAARDYLAECDRFEVEPVLNGKLILSSSPQGYLKCVKPS